MTRRSSRRPALRGVATRLLAMLLGLAVAAGTIIAMQVPLLHHPATFTSSMKTTAPNPALPPQLRWPSTGSGALYIPAINFVETWHDHVVPIASLTKMMTAYVALTALPLTLGESGPCTTVTAADVAMYQQMNSTDQSSALVVVGEQLCELQLLEGLLVHSAGNYAELLARLVAGSDTTFINQMNGTAEQLGLSSTHYADVSGYSALSVSTALDQARMAAVLMRSAVVRSIVIQPQVTLPVAGTLSSFTPYVGVGQVIGVKSGRTSQAGGCDVMAVAFRQGGINRIVYAVILGQRSGDMLGPAGDAALALSNSALALRQSAFFTKGSIVGRIGWGPNTTAVGLAHSVQVDWWAGVDRLTTSLHLARFTTSISRGQRVGWLTIRGVTTVRVALAAKRSTATPSIWQRLR